MSDRLMSQPKVEGFPLIGIGLLMVATLVLAGVTAHEKREAARQEQAQMREAKPISARLLIFKDGEAGDVDVIDATTGERLKPISGEAGFARSVLRTLAHARMRQGGSPSDPFHLSRTPGNALELLDPITGMRLDLGAFGPDPAKVFLPYLLKATVERSTP
jgi:putative photosynthetic complex assembly protein